MNGARSTATDIRRRAQWPNAGAAPFAHACSSWLLQWLGLIRELCPSDGRGTTRFPARDWFEREGRQPESPVESVSARPRAETAPSRTPGFENRVIMTRGFRHAWVGAPTG